MVLQRLPKSSLTPNRRYLMWFQCKYRDIPSLVVSLNIIDEYKSYSEVFPSIYTTENNKIIRLATNIKLWNNIEY